MQTATISRREFLDIVQRSYPGGLPVIRDEEIPSSVGGPEFTAVWRDRYSERDEALPSLICIPRHAQKDFFAWTYTYLPALRPLTAFIRVVDPSLLETLPKGNSTPSFGRFGEAFSALIIGEAVSYVEPRIDPRQLVSNACANTHSFAVTRAIALGYDEHIEEVSAAWYSVGEITKQSRRSFDVRALSAPFQVLHDLYSDGGHSRLLLPPQLRIIGEACHEIAFAGDVQDRTWRNLTSSFGYLSEVRDQMQESRENRVRAFDKAWEWFANNRHSDSLLSGFLCGYLGSRIAPGDLDHFGLVAKMLPVAPTASLWFSLCSGLQSGGQVLGFADGLGRRILRDLEQSDDVLGRPRCDLGLSELEVLFSRDKPLTDFRTGSSGLLTIELFPCVTTSIRWQRSNEFQVDLFERRDTSLVEARQLVRELAAALERVNLIRSQLARVVDVESDQPLQPKGDKRPKRR